MSKRPSERIIKNENEIIELMNQYNVKTVRVFGSIARGEDTETSDVDMIVDMPNSSLYNYGCFKYQLEKLLETPVDMLTYSSLEKKVLEHFIKNSISISELKAGTRLIFQEKPDKMDLNLRSMLWVIDRIIEMADTSEDEFMRSSVLKDAVTRNMQLLGQVASQLSDFDGLDLKGYIPLRDALFMNVDYSMLWKTVSYDLKPLRDSIRKYLKK